MRYRILRTTFCAIIVAFVLASCSEESNNGLGPWYNTNPLYSYSGAEGNLWVHMRQNFRMQTYDYKPQVREEIHWFQEHQNYLNHAIVESAPYIYYIYQQTQARHLPAELALIPVIESEYNPYARSRVGAIGLWQMMPKTGLGFGLKRDRYYDGRRDIVASTKAALDYFTYLHSFFNNNWLLAIAAYDCGEGGVMRTIHYNTYHGRSTQFWYLPLPYETRTYVPRLLAVAAIIKDPARYHIHLVPVNDAPYLAQVNIGRKPINLKKAAQLADVPVNTLKVLNPGLKRDTTDPRGPYTLLVPKDKAQPFRMRLAMLSHNEKVIWQEHIVKSRETLASIALRYRTNLAMLREVNGLTSDAVKPNETLLIPPSSPDAINNNDYATDNKQPNNPNITLADNSNQNSGNDAIANAAANASNQTADKSNSNNSSNAQPTTIIYHVKHGNTISGIAKKYNVSEKQLLAWNHLRRHHVLHRGERLIIKTNSDNDNTPMVADNSTTSNAIAMKTSVESSASTNTDNASTTATDTRTYHVRRGDDLRKLADRFHTSIAHIKTINNLASNDLQIGQVLQIPVRGEISHRERNSNRISPSDSNIITSNTSTNVDKTVMVSGESHLTAPKHRHIVYTVEAGDYIEKIAKHFRVSPKAIMHWNELSSASELKPGEKLIIMPAS